MRLLHAGAAALLAACALLSAGCGSAAPASSSRATTPAGAAASTGASPPAAASASTGASPPAAALASAGAAASAGSSAAPNPSGGAAAAVWSAGDSSGDHVKISYASPALSGLPLYAALRQDFFSKQHVHAAMLKMPSTPAIAALSKGDIDMVNQPALAIQGATRGLPFKILMGWWREAPWTLIGEPDLKSLQDLKGKNVATTAVGNSPYLYLQAALQNVGMDIKSDVNVISSRGTEDSYAFLLAGKVDAAVVSPPFPSQAETEGFHTIAMLGNALALPYTGLAATSQYVDQHHSTVVRTIRAVLDAMSWLSANPDGAARLAELYVGVDPAISKKATNQMLPLLSKTYQESPEGIQQALDAQARVTNTTIDVTPAQLVDYGPLQEALKTPR